jgi:DNA-binding MarR family transcriptional regulator
MIAAHGSPSNPNPSRSSIVCLCGCGRFRQAFEATSRWLTLEGMIVISIINDPPEHDAASQHSNSDLTKIDEVDLQKIELCDEFVVLNVNGYMDALTRLQISHAQRVGKPIRFVEAADWNPALRGVRRIPRADAPVAVEDEASVALEEGVVIDLARPFVVQSGAVLLYGPDPTRPAFTLVSDHVWPGVRWVPEVWYAEAASNTRIGAFSADNAALRPLGEIIRWAVATSGQISERMLWALFIIGSVSTQEELSAVIGCRRESVTSAMRDLRTQGLIEKIDGRIRLTDKGFACATKLCSLERDMDDAGEYDDDEEDGGLIASGDLEAIRPEAGLQLRSGARSWMAAQ